MTILDAVREELLSEARKSPGLLSDLANLERYIAETYAARTFSELLQNADDAEAGRFLVSQVDEWLVCANDGKRFTREDFESLCRSAASAKNRGQTIGYRGIGFKSVVRLAEEVHLFSGDLEATFSRELSRAEIGFEVPTPLVRIPHRLRLDAGGVLTAELAALRQAGYTTIFIFRIADASHVHEEFSGFGDSHFLFLNCVARATLSSPSRQTEFQVRRRKGTFAREERVEIESDEAGSSWLIHRFGTCDFAFSMSGEKVVPLRDAEALAHAFLPTIERTGFPLRINADFSTDPSRTRIIFDGTTDACIEDIALRLASLLEDKLMAGSDDLQCLSPLIDVATLPLQRRSLATELVGRVCKHLARVKENIVLSPNWLNEDDCRAVARALGVWALPDAWDATPVVTLLKYAGVRQAKPDTLLRPTVAELLSEQGCAEVAAFWIRNRQDAAAIAAQAPIWCDATSRASLGSLVARGTPLARTFVQTVEHRTSRGEFESFLASIAGDGWRLLLLDAATGTGGSALQSAPSVDDVLAAPTIKAAPENSVYAGLGPAWRGAEVIVADYFGSQGYRVEDRSRQNLGYDLFVEKGSNKAYIEVKLINYPGAPFILTSNEEATARGAGNGYVVALVLQTSKGVSLQLVPSPLRRFTFVRQCRQWVWECSEYEFAPQFTLDR